MKYFIFIIILKREIKYFSKAKSLYKKYIYAKYN